MLAGMVHFSESADAFDSPGGRVARLQVRGVAAGTGSLSLEHSPDVGTNVVVSSAAVGELLLLRV